MNHAAAERYPLAMRVVHWVMAACIIGLLALGWYMTPFESRSVEASDRLYYWHKSFGLLAMFLLLVRLVVRRSNRAVLPALPPGLSPAERILAKTSKFLLYGLMFAVPFIGYLHSSAYPFSSGVHFFVIDLPDLVAKDAALAATTVKIHRILAYVLMATVALHLLGTLKHRFFDRANDVLPRIL